MTNEYPTEKDLEAIKKWSDTDIDGLLDFIKGIWWRPDWGFVLTGKKVLRLELHTGGWSGNEDIISVLRETWLWLLYWQKTIRGGHHYFRIRKI